METKERLRQNLACEKYIADILYRALKGLLADRNAATIGESYHALLEYERRRNER